VKLRGRVEAPDWSRGRILSFHARGETTDSHGPLPRLLGSNDNFLSAFDHIGLRKCLYPLFSLRGI
jgi:hypothetical protein